MFRPYILELKELFLSREVAVNVLVCVVWASLMLGYMRGIINRLPVLGEYTDQVEVMTVVLPLLAALPILVNRFALYDYLFVFMYLFYYGFTYAVHPENGEFLNKFAYESLCLALPGYFIGRLIDIRRFFHTFVLISAVCVVTNALYYTVYVQNAKNITEMMSDDNMETAYNVLPHVLMLAWCSLRRFNIFATVLAVVGTVFLSSCGTRGPLFCVILFFCVYFVFYMNFKYSYLVKAVLLVVFATLLTFMVEITKYLVFLFTDMHLSTRVFEKFLSGEMGHDSGRGWLRDIVYRNMDVHGDFFGLGLMGTKVYGVIYPHNLILDFFSSYGYVLGGALLLLFFGIVALAIWKSRGTPNQVFVILLAMLGVVKLLLSQTFTVEIFFFMLLGFCVSQIRGDGCRPEIL